jgi:DNA (cytosine-5)-methyltransferase 1
MAEIKYTFIDLFAGCGGLGEGFLKQGYTALAHVEWEHPMVETLRVNLQKRWGYSQEETMRTVVEFDIQRTEELLKGHWSDESRSMYSDNSSVVMERGLDGVVNGRKVNLIIGGPPCQAYSIAGRAQDPDSMKNDYRNYLFESFVKVVDYFRPDAFVFENVPGMLSAEPGGRPVIERIYEAFNNIGYTIRDTENLKKSVYSAADFQVPQERHRVIIFGANKDCIGLEIENFYDALDSLKSNLPKKTVRDAIGNMPKFRPLEKSVKNGRENISHELIGNEEIPLHIPRYHNDRDREVFRRWISESMNDLPTKDKLDFYESVSGKRSNHNKYRSLEWDKPSPTIVSHLYKDGLMFIHPDIEQLRSITIREAALLQSFPMDYEFVGSNAYCYKMIGNAVPVLFAENIAKAAGMTLDKNRGKKKILNVLVACEESQRVCTEFRKLGHNAYSCDILPCSGGHPEWHFKQDVLAVIRDKGGVLETGESCFIDGDWDIMIAHPPCTYLAVSGARWFYHPDDKDLPVEQRRPHPRFPNRAADREEAAEFFMSLINAPIDHIAVENPIGVMNTRYRKADQIVQPYYFGDEASKATCLWLKNLPLLEPTNIVGKGEMVELSSGKRLPKWYSDALSKAKTPEERRNLRSKTFPGFAKAIAEQWSEYLVNSQNK